MAGERRTLARFMVESVFNHRDKPALQQRYSVTFPKVRPPAAIGFQSVFDDQIFGKMGVFAHQGGRQIVWDQFYPFGQKLEERRLDLQGIGLGTYAHTLVLLQVAELTRVIRDATVQVYGAEDGFQKILDRAGVPECSEAPVSLLRSLDGSIQSCDAIGFDTIFIKKRLDALLRMGQ